MMRRLAWCGTSRSTSAGVRWLDLSAIATDSGILVDANLKTSRPSITGRCMPCSSIATLTNGSCARPGPSTQSFSAKRPSAKMCVESTPRPSSSTGPSTAAPAPSPNNTAVSRPRVVLSSPRALTSAPTSRMCPDWPGLAGLDPRVGDREPVDESAALIAHVHGGDVGEAELALQEDAIAGLEMVGRAGAVHDAVDVLRREAGLGDRFLRGLARESHARVARLHPVARLDAAALHDPFVRRCPHSGEIGGWDRARRGVEARREECGWWDVCLEAQKVASDLRWTQD